MKSFSITPINGRSQKISQDGTLGVATMDCGGYKFYNVLEKDIPYIIAGIYAFHRKNNMEISQEVIDNILASIRSEGV